MKKQREINATSWFFKKTNKIGKLARVMKKEKNKNDQHQE